MQRFDVKKSKLARFIKCSLRHCWFWWQVASFTDVHLVVLDGYSIHKIVPDHWKERKRRRPNCSFGTRGKKHPLLVSFNVYLKSFWRWLVCLETAQVAGFCGRDSWCDLPTVRHSPVRLPTAKQLQNQASPKVFASLFLLHRQEKRMCLKVVFSCVIRPTISSLRNHGLERTKGIQVKYNNQVLTLRTAPSSLMTK